MPAVPGSPDRVPDGWQPDVPDSGPEEVSMSSIARCEFRGRAAGAAVVICPPGLRDEALRRAGRVASGGERPCTVWFWDDPALAPEAPPSPERPMSEAQ